MKYEIEEEQLIKRYILRQLASDEREVVEKRLMSDEEFFGQVLLVEEDLTEEYLEGSLSEGERKLFEDAFLASAESRQRIEFTRSLRKKSVEASTIHIARSSFWKKVTSTAYFRVAAAVVILLGLGVFLWWAFLYESETDKALTALRNAYRNQRPLEARISEFDYAPFPTSRGDGGGNIDHLQRDLARRILVEAALKDSGFQSHHALGRFYLSELDFDKAIGHFKSALEVDKDSASVHSDMGVALFERERKRRSDSGSEARIEEFARSLEHFTRAIELDDSLLEARFNRSLCYQELLLPFRAVEEWQDYLRRDADSGWTDEARTNLRLMAEKIKDPDVSREEIFQEFLDAYRAADDQKAWEIYSLSYGSRYNFVLEKLIDDYLDQTSRGADKEARDTLSALIYAGELVERKVGDRYASDIARVYRVATPERRKLLGEARARMREGYAQSGHSELALAAENFRKATEIFSQAGDRCEAVSAELRVAQAYLRLLKTKEALSMLQRLIQVSQSNEYRWLTGRIYYSIADARLNYQEYSESLSYNTRAVKESEQSGDLAGAVRELFQIAYTYELIDDSSKSLNFIQRGLALAERQPIEPRQQMYIYSVATDSFSSLGLFVAALNYQKEALRISQEINEPLTTSRYYQGLGVIYRELNNYDEAIKYAKLAFNVGVPLTDESIRQDIMASSSLALGHLYREYEQIDNALASYDQNIQLYDRLESQWLRYEAHTGKFLCYKAKGDVALAEQELEIALRLYEENRLKITEESNRNAFFDSAQTLYDAAIDFEYSSKSDSRRAFEIAESGRARSLLDLTSAESRLLQDEYGADLNLQTVSKPLTLAEIQQRLDDQTQIVQYSVLEDKILIWVVSKNELRSAVKKIGREELSKKVPDYLQRLVTPGEDEHIRRDAADLYDYLITPIEQYLNKDGFVCIVSDKLLNYIPYAALLSPQTGKYLIEDYTLVFAPSSTMFLYCSEKAREKENIETEKLLAVGDPSFDRVAFSLPDLSSARREAEQIASYYGGPAPLTGANARERAIKEAMAQADVIHLATHYVTDDRSPMASKLLLAKETTDSFASKESDGVLQAWEIYAMNLKLARLVVLAACQTGVERTYRGEGAINIARPFIKAGVPLVVASLWPVESQPTSDLMISFHKYRKHGSISTAEALRRAQLDMIASSSVNQRHPSYWASFILIGGRAAF